MKKKIVSLALAVCLLAIAAVGTLAYFTDTASAKNTFTVGNVDIKLDETDITKDNARTEEGNTYSNIYPGQTLVKDPKVTNVGSYDAYVKVDVTVPNAALKAFGINGAPYDQFKSIVTGGIMGQTYAPSAKADNGIADGLANDDYLLTYAVGDTATVFTVYALKPMAKDAAFTVFENIVVPADLDNANFADILADGFTMDIFASAIQANGFDSAAAAFAALAAE